MKSRYLATSLIIKSIIGECFPLRPNGRTKRYDYGKVICIFIGCVFAYVIALAFIRPAKLGHNFGVAHDDDMVDAAGTEALHAVVHRREAIGHDVDEGRSDGDVEGQGKVSRGVEKEPCRMICCLHGGYFKWI